MNDGFDRLASGVVVLRVEYPGANRGGLIGQLVEVVRGEDLISSMYRCIKLPTSLKLLIAENTPSLTLDNTDELFCLCKQQVCEKKLH